MRIVSDVVSPGAQLVDSLPFSKHNLIRRLEMIRALSPLHGHFLS